MSEFYVRGSGITTRQLQKAPMSSIYVWVNQHIDYAKILAHKLGREDLEIVSPAIFENSRLKGKTKPIILDHGVRLTAAQLEVYFEYTYRNNLD